ncbi:MAG: hypothetical protein ACLQNE_35970 [Thermoguttaceae bacterium]
MFCAVFGIAMAAVATAEEGLLPWGTKASTPTPATVQPSGNTAGWNPATPAPPSLSAPKFGGLNDLSLDPPPDVPGGSSLPLAPPLGKSPPLNPPSSNPSSSGGPSSSQIAPDAPFAPGSTVNSLLSGSTRIHVVPEASPPAKIADEKSDRKPAPGAAVTAEIETASFNGVTPGVSTAAEVEKAWGKRYGTRQQNGSTVGLYKVGPFEQVEVIFLKDKVQSIILRLNKTLPAETVATRLQLANLRAVLVSNDMGEVLGQSFPEKGVLMAFEPSTSPGKPTMNVAQIILEPVSAEAFVLRAETNLDTQVEASLRDADQAVKMAPQNARAHWLRARMLAIQGDYENAIRAAAEAVRLEPRDAQFRVTRAQILGQLGHTAEAVKEAGQAAEDAEQRPHVKARAQCLMGDMIGSGAQPDYKKAIGYHAQAIRTAAALTSNSHPAIRVPAKEVLIDANLGAARDTAWGNWKQKGRATQEWLKGAAEAADDLARNEGGTAEHRFRVASRALAAYVGLRGELDPTEWTSRAVSLGREMVAAAPDGPQKQQVQWDVGMALYDAVQIYQVRGQRDSALQYGQQAAELLEQSGRGDSSNPTDSYLLGRLYFRLGSIHAIPQKDHKAAVVWFDKAVPVLERSAARLPLPEQGRLGETLVSMGISYWETGERAKAVQLTQEGVALLDQAVKIGAAPRSALEVPQSNLATMRREMDRRKPADWGAGRIENAAQKTTVLR